MPITSCRGGLSRRLYKLSPPLLVTGMTPETCVFCRENRSGPCPSSAFSLSHPTSSVSLCVTQPRPCRPRSDSASAPGGLRCKRNERPAATVRRVSPCRASLSFFCPQSLPSGSPRPSWTVAESIPPSAVLLASEPSAPSSVPLFSVARNTIKDVSL